ncbi:polysaccharide deacetylase family protein [Peredibacter sp. HCB2-198]|uniref:polysaccharide deacetylase family protein n=1 Tax=Peredibacter sp. HCB2-198 TaxID=3383025 RepID=UPI0038B5767F
MLKWPFILSLMVITSCGGFKLWNTQSSSQKREIASLSMQQLLQEETQSFSAEIDEKLLSIHSYYVIAQSNLIQFDEAIPGTSLEELYLQGPYLRLVASRTQMDEIQDELKELWDYLHKKKDPKINILEERIREFSMLSPLATLAMENLAASLQLTLREVALPSKSEIRKEYEEQDRRKEFQIYEQNIEHLSHLMKLKIRSSTIQFAPHEGKTGNITGQEFPAKVWAITFDDGPDATVSPIVLKNLQEKKLKATFFQLGQKVEKDTKTAKLIRDAGMEIASHSYSHKLLTTVGTLTLEKEIKQATQNIEKKLDLDIKYFRLPYGIGITTPNVRQQIADTNLIHVVYNIDTLDWLAQSPDMIVKRAKAMMRKTPRDSGILLFHDTNLRTVQASIELMNHVSQEGRRVCTVGEIVTQMNEGVETVCPKF